MAEEKVLTGAIALIKVKGEVVGLMKTVSLNETFRRIPVRGIGTALPSEQAVTEWDGTLTCDFMMVDWSKSGIPGAIRRDFTASASQVATGNSSFEDQLILDVDGVQVDVFKKVKDVVDSDGKIKPKLKPIATVKRSLIDSDSMDVNEGNVASRRQSFKYLDPVLFT